MLKWIKGTFFTVGFLASLLYSLFAWFPGALSFMPSVAKLTADTIVQTGEDQVKSLLGDHYPAFTHTVSSASYGFQLINSLVPLQQMFSIIVGTFAICLGIQIVRWFLALIPGGTNLG